MDTQNLLARDSHPTLGMYVHFELRSDEDSDTTHRAAGDRAHKRARGIGVSSNLRGLESYVATAGTDKVK